MTTELDEKLAQLCKSLEQKVKDIDGNKNEISSLIEGIPNLSHAPQEIADLIVSTSKDIVEKNASIVIENSEEAMSKIPKHDLVEACVEKYKSQGKDIRGLRDDLYESINHMYANNKIKASNGYIILPLKQKGEK